MCESLLVQEGSVDRPIGTPVPRRRAWAQQYRDSEKRDLLDTTIDRHTDAIDPGGAQLRIIRSFYEERTRHRIDNAAFTSSPPEPPANTLRWREAAMKVDE